MRADCPAVGYKGKICVWRLKDQANELVFEYNYNGLNFRIAWQADWDADGDCTGDDTFYFCFDERWRIVATFRASDTSPKERFVYHAAGLGGTGGSSYIDDVICRDRDNNTAWTSAADGTLEQRRYLCHNWRSDVSAVVTSGGALVECMKYSAYGVPFGLPGGDVDSDGDWDVTDAGLITGGYSVVKDVELDGDVDANDATAANGAKSGYYNTGRGILSAINIRKGYAGYELASELSGTKWHVRHRVLDSELGRWTRRDPLGYVDGLLLFEYGLGMPIRTLDTSGTTVVACTPTSAGVASVEEDMCIPPETSCAVNSSNYSTCAACCENGGEAWGIVWRELCKSL